MKASWSVAAMAALAAGLAAPPSAAETDPAGSEADFLGVCPAALFNPGDMASTLGARGLAEVMTANPAPTWSSTVYASTEGERMVTLNRERYSDMTMVSCLVSFPAAMSADALKGIRTKLEGLASIGKLEGELVQATPGVRIARFKRPGNAPVVTVNLTAGETVTTLMINRWDLEPGK